MRFVGFVNRVLLLHDVGRLNKFRLVWTPRRISSHATSWISTAISKNVHELFLCFKTRRYLNNRTSPEPFVMPICVFSCNTLRFLELGAGISVSEAIAVCLPKLETLKLVLVNFQSEEAFEKLIRGCPVLINLLIIMPYYFYRHDDFTYIISSTSLRHLEVDIEYQLGVDRPLYISLELEASSLEYLTVDGVIPIFLVKKSLSSLVEAKLDIDLGKSSNFSDVNICIPVVEAVRVFDCAKALILSVHIIWALSCAPISLSNFATINSSTEFKRLVKLEAGTYCCACSSIRDFIQYSHNLEVLTMTQINNGSVGIDHDHTNWTAPMQVPRCLSNSLKKVRLDGYKGLEDERDMIRYMLEHGSVLEVVQITSSSKKDGEKLELLQEICEFPRKSPTCKVQFRVWPGQQRESSSCCINSPHGQ